MKGFIISIEGTDGSGKHTQQQLLLSKLKELGHEVFDQCFPNYDSDSSAPVKMYLAGEFGTGANSLDAYQASSLYAVDRLCTHKKTIAEHYDNGKIILFDRYVQSNFIHHGSKIDDIEEKYKYIDYMCDLEYNKLGLPKADLVFFIEMPVEKSLELARSRADYKTGGKKDIHEEDPTHLQKSYDNGLNLAKKLGWTIIHCVDKKGDLKTIEDIHKEIMEKVNEYLQTHKSEPNSAK